MVAWPPKYKNSFDIAVLYLSDPSLSLFQDSLQCPVWMVSLGISWQPEHGFCILAALLSEIRVPVGSGTTCTFNHKRITYPSENFPLAGTFLCYPSLGHFEFAEAAPWGQESGQEFAPEWQNQHHCHWERDFLSASAFPMFVLPAFEMPGGRERNIWEQGRLAII